MLTFDKVTVLGVVYSVIQVAQAKIARAFNDGESSAIGFCDDLDEKIVLASELKGRQLKKIFVHEWTHAVCGVNGLNQTLDPVVAEGIAQSFAHALLELLAQDEVRKFLLKKC